MTKTYDAIIIGESIYTKIRADGHSLDNVVAGARRVAIPATFGVLTTIAAFGDLTRDVGAAGVMPTLAADIHDAALSGLEADAGNPLLSVMRYFAPELDAHAERGECPAGVCQPIRSVGAVAS